MQDETDIAWQLGIGCGGLVRVLLQPIHQENHYLNLINLRDLLSQRQACTYQIDLESTNNQALTEESNLTSNLNTFYNIKIKPTPALVIFGGGIDAKPLVDMAKILGWHITLIDSRPSYARKPYFSQADCIIKQNYDELTEHQNIYSSDAIVIMHHNIDLDAIALKLSNHSHAKYVGLLGPQHRTVKVFTKAGLTSHTYHKPLANPIGLDLGGELPESIALSILSQAHAQIEEASAGSLGNFIQKLELACVN